MKIEIVSQIVPLNQKDILSGVVKEVFIYSKIEEEICMLPIRYKIKDGKVTAL